MEMGNGGERISLLTAFLLTCIVQHYVMSFTTIPSHYRMSLAGTEVSILSGGQWWISAAAYA